ncbi:cAMP-dependent protein kinase inhibitor beta [Varanus komodoensis]|uniref:cAMP-dependent protein kinase inhibitor n=1 Tax=Varanus komodoensis TaxID=61221 RepID=A0A8D2J148_VARKO|nr:cAMP-dependent protein kinase inhibitor beta [Varanus komodoensis]XP_044281470.1 cAMP-dependent protein kinase inhibitor beta [Varanus komodoensis]KAF7254313.1 cAMP-dependent protein kinase inhibitor beta [Varanus komodoensis]
MTEVEPVVTDFAASGRAGRRNALPDILGSSAGAGTSDLPHKLAELSVSKDEGAEGGGTPSSDTTMGNQGTEGKGVDS